MTDERLASLEAKWSREFGGQEVCDLIEEVRRLQARVLTYEPLDGSCCAPREDADEETRAAYSAAHACGCHWPGNHRAKPVESDLVGSIIFGEETRDGDKVRYGVSGVRASTIEKCQEEGGLPDFLATASQIPCQSCVEKGYECPHSDVNGVPE